jgi:AAA+ ATPase superfamily predicted ATPase
MVYDARKPPAPFRIGAFQFRLTKSWLSKLPESKMVRISTSSPGFIGRRSELSALERRYASSRAELIPLYGRRRVGKTELLLRFSSGRPTVYFTASDKLKTPQIADFMRAAAEWLGVPHLAEAAPGNWEAALRLAVAAAPKGQKLLLVLDEFQWLCQSSPEVPSVIQRLWDLEWQRGNGLMLVLCGSFIGFMEREVLGARSPLHGRRTADLRLQPFGFQEAAEFNPTWSLEEQARAYFVCGGIPAYLRRFAPGRSVTQNIAAEFFEVDAFFQREPEFLLREELAEVKQEASILEAVALGRRAQSDIARAVGLRSRRRTKSALIWRKAGVSARLVPNLPSNSGPTIMGGRVSEITILSLFGPEPEKCLQAGSDGLQRCARHRTQFFGVTCLGVDGPHLMRQNHALDRKSWRNRDFQIVAGPIGAAAMGSDGTDDS